MLVASVEPQGRVWASESSAISGGPQTIVQTSESGRVDQLAGSVERLLSLETARAEREERLYAMLQQMHEKHCSAQEGEEGLCFSV